MKQICTYLALIVACTLGTWLLFHKPLEDVPGGCDDFGYANLARAICEGKTFEYHASRPWLPELLDTLRANGFTPIETSYIAVPHTYYVVPDSYQVINMYSPGTSWMLSWFPEAQRKTIFPALVMLGFLVIPVLALRRWKQPDRTNFTGADAMLFFSAFIFTQLLPFCTEFSRVNSLAPTFGLLMAAGLLLTRNPILSCALIALSANFRYSNLLLLAPVAAFVPFPKSFTKNELCMFVKTGALCVLATVICVAPHLAYVYRLLGNPLRSTYSSLDTAFNAIAEGHFSFYFDPAQKWLQFHLVLLTALGWMVYKKHIDRITFLRLLLFPLLNYALFIFKTVKMNYYPYASAMILVGALLHVLSEMRNLQANAVRWIATGSAVLILLIGGITYSVNDHRSYEDGLRDYAGLCRYDIVWGDEAPGTGEFVCRNNNGFRYVWASPRSRMKTMQFLHSKKMSQVFVLKDIAVDRKAITDEMKACGFEPRSLNDPALGELLLIE